MDDERAGSCWLKDGQGEIKSYTGLTSGPKYCKGESLLCGGSLFCSTFYELKMITYMCINFSPLYEE